MIAIQAPPPLFPFCQALLPQYLQSVRADCRQPGTRMPVPGNPLGQHRLLRRLLRSLWPAHHVRKRSRPRSGSGRPRGGGTPVPVPLPDGMTRLCTCARAGLMMHCWGVGRGALENTRRDGFAQRNGRGEFNIVWQTGRLASKRPRRHLQEELDVSMEVGDQRRLHMTKKKKIRGGGVGCFINVKVLGSASGPRRSRWLSWGSTIPPPIAVPCLRRRSRKGFRTCRKAEGELAMCERGRAGCAPRINDTALLTWPPVDMKTLFPSMSLRSMTCR